MKKRLSSVLLGSMLWIVIGLIYFMSSLPMWEDQSPDGNSYLLGWKTVVVLFLLMVATQSVSYIFLRWLHNRRLRAEKPISNAS